MTRSGAGPEFTRVVDTIRRVRCRLALWRALAWLAGTGAVLALGVHLPVAALETPGAVAPMLLLAVAVGGAAGCGFGVARTFRLLERSTAATEIETASGLAAGELTGAVELGARGHGSRELAALQRERVAAVLAGRAAFDLLPESMRRLRKTRQTVLPALGGTLILGAFGLGARPAMDEQGSWLLRPWSVTFPPPPPSLVIESDGGLVLRGDSLVVRVRAPGRGSVRVWWSVPGEPRRGCEEPVTETRATAVIGPIVASTSVWAEDLRKNSSDTLHVEPVDPLMLTDLVVGLSFPAYLGRMPDELPGYPAALTVPEGTTIRLQGRTNHPIRRVALVPRGSVADTISFEVKGDIVAAEIEVTQGGKLQWILTPLGQVPGVRKPPDIELVVVRDEEPTVDISYPGDDVSLPMGRLLPLLVDARDDHGVESVELFMWRETAVGMRSDTGHLSGPARPRDRRVSWRPVLDLDSLEALPGDVLAYFAVAKDASPRTADAVSDTFRVRVRTLAELDVDIAERAAALAAEARSLEERAEGLGARARTAARRVAASSSEAPLPAAGRADFGSTQQARELLGDAQDLEGALESAVDRLEALRLDMQPVTDAALRARLEQLGELYREILDSGLGERIEELENALRGLERNQLRAALESLAHDAEAVKRNLDRVLGLMERVALEESLKAVQQRTGELADQQKRAAAERYRDTDWANRQQARKQAATALGSDLAGLAESLEVLGAERSADLTQRAARDVARASEAMQVAGEEASAPEALDRGDAGARADRAQQAAESLSRADEQLAAASEALSRDWKAEALEAVERALSETLQLAAEQAEIVGRLDGGTPPRELAGRQASIGEGLDNLTQALANAGERSALLDRRAGVAATRARDAMEAAARSMARGGSPRSVGAREAEVATEALGELASVLLSSRQAMSEAGSGTGMEEALDRLAEIGRRQAGLNAETGELFLLGAVGEESVHSLESLAGRQAELSRQLEALVAQPETGELAGRPDELAREADEIARRMTGGELDREIIARQERLFRRLLAAGRTLERDDEPRGRESRTAIHTPAHVPGAPEPDALAGPRYPYPSDRELEGLTAGQRRLVYEYFDRLNRGPVPEEPRE